MLRPFVGVGKVNLGDQACAVNAIYGTDDRGVNRQPLCPIISACVFALPKCRAPATTSWSWTRTTQRLHLTPAHYRFLADRHFGVGADQILTVRPAPQPDVDFEYVIHNADGGEVEQCGNGSRCFVRFVREQGLTDKTTVRVKVHGGVITLQEMPDGQVTVDMGAPVFDLPQVPFVATHATAVNDNTWQLALSNGDVVNVGVVSMGNPHAVQVVANVATAPVLQQGALIENHMAFPRRVNAGFMQVLSRNTVRLRVF